MAIIVAIIVAKCLFHFATILIFIINLYKALIFTQGENDVAGPGEYVVSSAGIPFNIKGNTNILRVDKTDQICYNNVK